LEFDAFHTNPVALAIDALHTSTFHRGLGYSLLASPANPIHAHDVASYAHRAYSKANLVLVATGATPEEITPHINEFWGELPAGTPLSSPASTFSAGETRIPHPSSQNVFALAFPGSSLYGKNSSPELVVLAHLLGGPSPVKWSIGHSPFAKLAAEISPSLNLLATNISYSDAGLFTILVTGSEADVAKAASGSLKLLREIAKGGHVIKPEEVKRAIAAARYATYASTETRLSGLEPVGQAILDTGKLLDPNVLVSELGKVTPEKVKLVCPLYMGVDLGGGKISWGDTLSCGGWQNSSLALLQ
jgi:ubiquinol-cytochrome c reductase core subunit 2